MKKILFLALVAVLFLTGCVEYGITIKVNKDGSGEIVENMLLSNQMMNMAKAMSPGGENPTVFTKEKQIEKAPNFGENVAFKSLEEVTTATQQGYKVVYSFSDINKLELSEDMFTENLESITDGMNMGDDDDEMDDKDDEEEGIEKFFSFDYKSKGKLVIHNGFSKAINEAKKELKNSDNDEDEDSEDVSDAEIEQQMAMAKMFIKGMKFYTKLEFDSIKDANVPYENNQITLLEIDMDKIMNDKETFKEFMIDGGEQIEKFLNNEKKIEGITFHYLDKITVDFK